MKWPTACLGEVAQVVSGATPKSSVEEYWDGDVCVQGSGHTATRMHPSWHLAERTTLQWSSRCWTQQSAISDGITWPR